MIILEANQILLIIEYIVIKHSGRHETNVVIYVSNHYDIIKEDGKSGYISTKSERGHGYGLSNIRKYVEKYNGTYSVTATEGIFCMEIIFSDLISGNS